MREVLTKELCQHCSAGYLVENLIAGDSYCNNCFKTRSLEEKVFDPEDTIDMALEEAW